MKIIAFHLPQYHEIEENNKWWGKGFTEWTNVKSAEPLYKGHDQPRIPYDNQYYNMKDINTIKWQADLATSHGIYGFCYYHYWFNGKLLLQEPLELLKDCQEISINYCFCWANEPWTRSWEGKNRKVIMPQEYGDESEWEQHFQYLLPFFKDERYIKENNCPMFILYKAENILNCDKMIDYFDRKCKENGFSGIYAVEEINTLQRKSCCSNSRAIVEFEPSYTINNYPTIILALIKLKREIWKKIFKRPIFISYDYLWKKIISYKFDFKDKEVFLGGFIDWDNSPRRGKEATIIKGYTIKKFEKYLLHLLEKAKCDGNKYIFLNAWNEWGEGAYLEPDVTSKNEKLSTIKRIAHIYK